MNCHICSCEVDEVRSVMLRPWSAEYETWDVTKEPPHADSQAYKQYLKNLEYRRAFICGEGVQQVWRVEGQMRRPILKQYGIDSLDGFASCLPGLWLAITTWASLRLQDDANASRRSLHPLWALVQSASSLLGDGSLLLRRTQSESTAPVEWYVAHILGCLVGLAARVNVAQLADALVVLGNLAAEYQSPQAFAARVQVEAIRLGMTALTTLPP